MSGNDVLNTQTPLTLSYRSPDALRVPKTKADTSEEPTLDIIGETVDILDHISITNAASIAVERAESLAAKNLLSKQKQPAWRTMSATKRVAAASKSDRSSVLTYSDHQIERSSISVQLSPKSKETATGSSVLPAPSAALVTSRQSSFASKLPKASSRMAHLKEPSQRLFSPSKINGDCNSVQLSRTSNGTATISSVLPALSAVFVTSRLSSFDYDMVPLKGVSKIAPKNTAGTSIRLLLASEVDKFSVILQPSQISMPPVPSIVSPGILNVLFDKANRFKIKKRTTAVYDSGLCNIPLCKMVNQDTIGCEGCDRWFHYKCGKIKQVDYPENVPFFCSNASLRKRDYVDLEANNKLRSVYAKQYLTDIAIMKPVKFTMKKNVVSIYMSRVVQFPLSERIKQFEPIYNFSILILSYSLLYFPDSRTYQLMR
ncbi:hypothetical protein GHT06_016807 [Daphnia sinensis]|uniref:Uncharacterized protein n=1 Tax=Daphnia sinensis TaxID=1820382 RepID=A0AAD5PRC5_9CRUS|nr:hypothetical protein GHT06_016807 [Daphnia sinensis]